MLHDRFAQRSGLTTSVLGAHRKEKRFGAERRTAAPVTGDDPD
jgi:hypothetical protein